MLVKICEVLDEAQVELKISGDSATVQEFLVADRVQFWYDEPLTGRRDSFDRLEAAAVSYGRTRGWPARSIPRGGVAQ